MSCRVHRSRSNSILISNWKPHAAFIPPAGAAWTRRSFRPSAPCLDLLRLAVSKHKRRQVQEFPACLPACRAPDIATHFAKNATLPHPADTFLAANQPRLAGPGIPLPASGACPGWFWLSLCAASATSCTPSSTKALSQAKRPCIASVRIPMPNPLIPLATLVPLPSSLSTLVCVLLAFGLRPKNV